MSENVRLAERLHEAFAQRDLGTFLACWHPECEYRPALERGTEGAGGVYKGHEGIRRWWEVTSDQFDDLSSEILETRELGDRVLVSCRVRGRGHSSDFPVEVGVTQVVTVRGGRAVASQDPSTTPKR